MLKLLHVHVSAYRSPSEAWYNYHCVGENEARVLTDKSGIETSPIPAANSLRMLECSTPQLYVVLRTTSGLELSSSQVARLLTILRKIILRMCRVSPPRTDSLLKMEKAISGCKTLACIEPMKWGVDSQMSITWIWSYHNEASAWQMQWFVNMGFTPM